MRDHFNCLFILPENSKQSKHPYFTASTHFPVNAHFEYSHKAALAYLNNCSQEDFPSIIIMEDAMGYEQNLVFIEEYRTQIYLFNIDTVLFNCNANNANRVSKNTAYPAIISGSLPLPFDKKTFMKNVFPLLTVYMV